MPSAAPAAVASRLSPFPKGGHSWKESPGGTLVVSTIVRYTMAPVFWAKPADLPRIGDVRTSGMGVSSSVRSEGIGC